jgi:hypothetical protein
MGRPEECAIANEIDHPWSPVRGSSNEIDRGVSELDPAVITGNRQPARHVRFHFSASQWDQLASD